ncbi:MAG: metallophosphoesterase [Verrucomicrobiales bacterium]
MNRRHFIGALASSAAVAAVGQDQTNGTSDSSTKPVADFSASSIVRTPLSLMAPRLDGVEAVWAVNQLSRARLEWEGEDGTSGVAAQNSFGFTPQGANVLRVRLNGLKPGASYRVRSVTTAVADEKSETSSWKRFRTLNPSARSSKFVVWNDTHINNPTIQKLHEITPAADFMVWNGDTCNDWTKPELLVPTLLHPGGRDITEGRPLFIGWGNHDVRGQHAFQMPEIAASPNGLPYHAFRAGPVAVICLHTGEDKPDNHPSFKGRVAFEALRREQGAWLSEVIRQPELREAPYRIVFCHIPLRWLTERVPDYDNDGYDHVSLRSRDAWHQSLVEWKTQLVISGHTHRHAYLPHNEQFPYAQITGGGPQPQAATFMTAEATSNELTIEVKDLEKQTKHAVKLMPLV